MNLTKTNWPSGWTPSADPINGDPSGLLRMDNLQLDEQGVLSLVKGLKKVNTSNLPDYVYTMYSKTLEAKEVIWAGLNVNGHTVLRSKNGNFSDAVTIASGNSWAVFGDALGAVVAAAGSVRVKDNGTTITPLGLQTPSAPVATLKKQQVIEFGSVALSAGYEVILNISTAYTIATITGTSYGTINDQSAGVNATTDPTTLACILEASTGMHDLLNINGNASFDPTLDNFQFQFTPDATAAISSLFIAFVLDAAPFADPDKTYNDAYVYGFGNVTTAKTIGGNPDVTFPTGQTQTFNVPRGQFLRVGNDSSLDWTKVTGIYVAVQATAESTFNFGPILVCGGALGQLNGIYKYVQVNVNDNGIYQARSAASTVSNIVNVINGSVTLTPGTADAQTTDIFFYRISIAPTDGTQPTSFLSNYYLVAQTTPGVAVVDSTSDNQAIEENEIANFFLRSMDYNDSQGTGDIIYGMEGLFFERMLYMGLTFVYVSDSLNPDAVDSRFTLRPSGDPLEKNLWIKRLTNNVLILATTKNLYEISGTLALLPDGTLDINLIPIGENYPPLSQDCCAVNGAIYYTAADGFRVTRGSNSTLLSPQLRLLFQGQTRSDVPGILVAPNNLAKYSIAIGKTRLYAAVPMTDGTRRLIVYDLINNTWRLLYTNPLIVFVTQSDRVLFGYNDSPDVSHVIGDIFEAEKGDGITDASGTLIKGLGITFQTVFDANQQPRNRKDTFTLKLVLDTGGAAASVFIAKDGGAYTFLSNVNSNGVGTVYIPLNNVTLGFRYSIKIVDVNLFTTFKIYEYTIEYEPRPEQLDYLRILPVNLGTISRKRITAYAFVIDTLGNNIVFTPYLDNVVWSVSGTINNSTKLTYIFYFTSEAVATDIAGILSGGVFEFYGLNLEECVSEKLPTPVEFLVIPPNNYGIPNRKRHTSYKFQILTRGVNVTFTPILDGVAQTPAVFNTTIKTTVEYYFTHFDIIGIDIGGTLSAAAPFEFYGVVVPQDIEVLPPKLKFFVIPKNNYGTPSRKRHSSYKFQINTFGYDVAFTPSIDGTQFFSTTVNTGSKQTVEIFFTSDQAGIDIGGFLESATDHPFEFYGVIIPQQVETLPPRLEFFKIPNTNFGVSARKRVRTLPMVIDTNGQDVTFAAIVDGVLQSSTTTFNTTGKTTVFHYFSTDIFGTDFGGTLTNTQGPFEFYGMETPETVEVLPVGKKFDQLGPYRFDKTGKLFGFRVRLISNGDTAVAYKIYGDSSVSVSTYGTEIFSGSFTVVPGVDDIYEVQLPKNVNTSMVRLVLGPTSFSFHRYDVLIKVQMSGMESESKWVPIR